jgi:hypothetical protein
MMEKEAAKRPLPTAALYGLQNLQRLDNDLPVSERHGSIATETGRPRDVRPLSAR